VRVLRLAGPKDTKADGTAKTDEEKKKDQEEYDLKKRERESKIEAGKKREQNLARRFADWYYVISAESFKKLHKTKADLIKKPEPVKPEEPKVEDKKPGDEKPK
jgi:chlorite dismutase